MNVGLLLRLLHAPHDVAEQQVMQALRVVHVQVVPGTLQQVQVEAALGIARGMRRRRLLVASTACGKNHAFCDWFITTSRTA